MSDYEVKPGEGSLFENNPPNGRHEKAPRFRGFLALPNGQLVGVACWVVKTKTGKTILSLKCDDREGEFQAKRLGFDQMRMDESPARGRQQAPADDEEDSPFAGRGAQRSAPKQEQKFSPDFDDEIPF